MKEYFYKGNKIIERDGMFYAYAIQQGDIIEYEAHSLKAAQDKLDKAIKD